MKTILVDLDGVVVNYMGHVLLRLKTQPGVTERYPEILDVNYEDISFWGLGELFPNIEIKQLIDITKTLPEMFLGPEPIEGSLKALEIIASEFNVFLCSSTFSAKHEADHVYLEKIQWVRRYLGSEWVDRVILTRDKTVVSGDILIDDKPRISGINKNPSWQHVLFDQPWNREIEDLPRLVGWDNPEQIVKDLHVIIAS
jgi:5'-nucleotidase